MENVVFLVVLDHYLRIKTIALQKILQEQKNKTRQ